MLVSIALYRKNKTKPARLFFSGVILMDVLKGREKYRDM